jgi:hypothetical protein
MNDTMSIWNKVCETDKEHTKTFQRGGGFKGTSINQTYQVKRATELWGPIGDKWGFVIAEEAWVDGAPLIENGNVVGREVVNVVTIRLWYPGEGGEKAYVEHKGQTIFVGKNKYGYFTDEEASKKSVTDGLSKCLAMLGFSADIYLGLWDDNKYVNNKADMVKPPERKITLPPAPPVDERVKNAKDAIQRSRTVEDLNNVRQRYLASKFPDKDVKVLEELYNAAASKL